MLYKREKWPMPDRVGHIEKLFLKRRVGSNYHFTRLSWFIYKQHALVSSLFLNSGLSFYVSLPFFFSTLFFKMAGKVSCGVLGSI